MKIILILIFCSLALTQASKSEEMCKKYEKYSYEEVDTNPLPSFFNTGPCEQRPGCHKKLLCDSSTGLIVGGTEAKPHEFPHFALIGFKKNGEKEFKCGGSIISEKFILTAAHCQADNYGTQASFVRVGEHKYNEANSDRKDYDIESFITHDYNAQTNANDIALIKLTNPIKFSLNVRPACLHQNSGEKLFGRTMVAIGMGNLGYGEASSSVLMKVNLSVVYPKIKCSGLNMNVTIQICVAGNRTEEGNRRTVYGDTCQGDSGGAIQQQRPDNRCVFDLYGITSYGGACGFGSGMRGNGAVYTRISHYLSWIEKIVWS